MTDGRREEVSNIDARCGSDALSTGGSIDERRRGLSEPSTERSDIEPRLFRGVGGASVFHMNGAAATGNLVGGKQIQRN